jgi:hypothetical protein
MNNNVLCGIGNSVHNLVGVVTLNKRACGANYGALSAAYAAYVVKLLVERAADNGVKAAVVRADYRNILLLAGSNAAAAKDTLVVVANKVKCAVILFVMSFRSNKLCFVYAVFKAKLLKLAAVASGAGQTLFVVV